MDNVRAIMRVIECVTKLTHPGCYLVRLKNFLLFLSPQVRERFAVDVLHRNAAGAFVVYEVVNANDVRMRQFETALCLSLELIKYRMISNHEVGKKFQRDIALQFFVVCQPDNPHSASPEDLDQRVAAKNSLAASELTRRRCCDTAGALVSHLGNIFVTRMERKVKAKLGWNR